MKFLAFVAAVAASNLTVADFDECKSHADCGKFFNEPMVCADVKEGWPNVFDASYTKCTLHAFCGFKHDAQAQGWGRKEVTCKPGAPQMPTTSLVTDDHREAMKELLKQRTHKERTVQFTMI